MTDGFTPVRAIPHSKLLVSAFKASFPDQPKPFVNLLLVHLYILGGFARPRMEPHLAVLWPGDRADHPQRTGAFLAAAIALLERRSGYIAVAKTDARKSSRIKAQPRGPSIAFGIV